MRVVGVAAVHLQAVNAPTSVRVGVGGHVAGQRAELVLALARVLAARESAHIVVRPQLEALGVDVIAERLHARREARRVCHELAARAVPIRPAVVDVDVLVAERAPLRRGEDVGVRFYELLADAVVRVGVAVDLAAEALPRHPAHRRRPRQAVVEGSGARDDDADCEKPKRRHRCGICTRRRRRRERGRVGAGCSCEVPL